MIDNLVHIGHNVSIGKNCIIAAMTEYLEVQKLEIMY